MPSRRGTDAVLLGGPRALASPGLERPRRRRPGGATLTEVIITTGIFSLLVLALFGVMKYGIRSWKNIESKNTIQTQLRKVELFLLEDLKRASYDQIRVRTMPAGWSAGNGKSLDGKEAHGPALWFLSAMDDNNQAFLRDSDGKPQWQRNVLYYVTKPADNLHRQLYGYLCQPDTSAPDNPYDTRCPHKWLIRKEIKVPTLLTAADVESQYLLAPASRDLLNPPQTGLVRAQVLADSLLAFRITLKKPEVLVDLKAFRVLEAGDLLQVGSSSLDNNVFTVQYDARVVPNN